MKYIASVIVKSNDIGLNGNLFGAILLQWLDQYGALYTYKYLHHRFVTYKIGETHFLRPAKQGDCIDFYIDQLSFNKMSCSFNLIAKNSNAIKNNDIIKTNMTFVAIDENTGKAVKMNPFLFELDEFKKYTFDKIKKYVSDDKNKFHNLSYIENMISELDKLKLNDDVYKKLYLAICYQDTFYCLNDNLNEEKSAKIFLQDWNFLHDDIKKQISDLIISSKIKSNFKQLSNIYLADILHDLNFSSFMDIDVVRNNDVKIKYERSSVESQKDFIKNKIDMLIIIMKENIFISQYFKKYNKFTLENIKEYEKELNNLYQDMIENK